MKNNPNNVTIATVQWKMQLFASVDTMLVHIDSLILEATEKGADFILFPELFTTPLIHLIPHTTGPEAIIKLSEYTDQFVKHFNEMAVKNKINIITGSMPIYEEGIIKNVGYVCHRDRRVEKYEKLHITPAEESLWGVKGGNTLKTFDTDMGKIGVLICYDVEFPELGRLLAEEGMQILFVPFNTYNVHAYMRVRLCAAARAVEDECYVVISGSTGDMPEVANMETNYSQVAIFTPSDNNFPSNAIAAESGLNTEELIFGDIDLSKLEHLHNSGSVKNLKERRTDFYSLKKL